MNQQDVTTAQKADRLETANAALVEGIARWATNGEFSTSAIPNLSLARWEQPSEPTSFMIEPSICLVAQGTKRVLLGEDAYIYDAHHFLITSVDLPVVVQVIEASRERPHLGMILKLDRREIAQLMVDSSIPVHRARQADRGIAVSEVSLPLLGAFQRLLDLLAEPEEIPILAPLIEREILFRLLRSEQGARLRQIATAGTHSYQVARAIDWLKGNFTQSLRVDALAAHAGMSTSALHLHFRNMTAMSPLQYQKWLRLHEARRLMLMSHLDAATVSYQVGYESPSQFSREYNRLFGAPPLRDITHLRQMAVGGSV